jgi:hypothetical protein
MHVVQSWVMSEVRATPYPLLAFICGCGGGFVLVQWLVLAIKWPGIMGKESPEKVECRKTMARYILIGGVAGVIVYATPWPLAAIAAGLAGPAALTGKLYQPRLVRATVKPRGPGPSRARGQS